MAENLGERLDAALARVVNPRTGRNVLEAEMVRDVAMTPTGQVYFTVLLSPADDATLVREIRRTVEEVPGVTAVQVDIRDAQAPAPTPARHAPRALPIMQPERPAAARPSAPVPQPMPGLGRIIAISSGKGGVGKSTVATNLAISLARGGQRIGLMDADIYGPNIPRMMGVDEPPRVEHNRIIPLEAHGIKLMSIGFIVERDQPAIWRGPIVMKVIGQFLKDVAWGTLDWLLVDLPPGTGDAQLSLVQQAQVQGAIIVTTPQEVATGDALRGAKMFQRVGVPVLGIVENMSWFDCGNCGTRHALFGEGGGQRLADELGLPLIGQIPLAPGVMTGGDTGQPIAAAQPGHPVTRAFAALAERVDAAMSAPSGS